MIWTSPFPATDESFAALPELIRGAAARTPEQPALIDAASGTLVSYGTLADRIGRVAAGLADRGFAPGDVLAICAPNIAPWAGMALGAMAAGGTVTGLSPLATGPEVSAQLTTARAAVLVTTAALLPGVREAAAAAGIREIIVAGGGPSEQPGRSPVVTRAADLLAGRGRGAGPGSVGGGPLSPGQAGLLPFSSGTTGLPKGVLLTHASLTAAVRQLGGPLALTGRDRFLAVAPFAHVMGFIVSLCTPLAAGAAVVTLPRYSLPGLLAAAGRYRATVLAVPPPVMTALAGDPEADRHDLSSLRLIVSGGAPLGAAVQQAVAHRFPHAAVGQGYGLTETAAVISVPGRDGTPPGAAGRLAPGTELRVVDPATSRDAAGEPGELWVRGPQVMAGYLGDEAATAGILGAGGWLRTGDLGRAGPDGCLFLTGRLKELIKVNAYQVAPAELEAVLLGHPLVADVAVIPQPDEHSGEVPVAVIVPRDGLDPDQLIGWVADRVAPWKRIRAVRLTGRIPRTPSGKTLYRELTAAGCGPAGATRR